MHEMSSPPPQSSSLHTTKPRVTAVKGDLVPLSGDCPLTPPPLLLPLQTTKPRVKAVEGDLVLVSGDRPLTAWDTRSQEGHEGEAGGGSGGGRGGRGRGSRGGRGARGGRGRGGRRPTTVENHASPLQETIRVSAEAARQGVFGVEHVVIPLAGAVWVSGSF